MKARWATILLFLAATSLPFVGCDGSAVDQDDLDMGDREVAADAGPDASSDASRRDAGQGDGDRGGIDGDFDLDFGAPDRGGRDAEADVFPFEPDPLCAEPTPIEIDRHGGFELAPAPLGSLVHVQDIDGDGRSELFAITYNHLDTIEPSQAHRSLGVRLFGWDDGEGLVSRGDLVGFTPLDTIDLGPPHGVALVGGDAFIDPATFTYARTIGVRADQPGAEWRFDESVALFVHLDGRDRPVADYLYPFDLDVFDGDADGRPEILTFDGDILEWTGDGFEVTWRVIDADPRDEARGIGGNSYGRMTHGDFDDDGLMEFMVDGTGNLENGIAKHARIYENRGDDDYRLVTRLPYGATNAQFAATGDLDGDGRPELLFGGSPTGCMRFEIWAGVADDTYVRLARIDHFGRDSIPTNQGITAFGDLDGDGDDELVINISDAIVAWDWDGMALQQIMAYPYCDTCNWSPVWTGDLEGDGIDEIFFTEQTGGEVSRRVYESPTGIRILRRVAGD